MANDFDFRAGNKHFRGNGWRGLVALGLWLIVRGTIFVVAIIASPTSSGFRASRFAVLSLLPADPS